MRLGLVATAILLVALLSQLGVPMLTAKLRALRARRRERALTPLLYDPGRELRAEQRARALLRSCINEEEWEMYRDLGFLRIWGSAAGSHPQRRVHTRAGGAEYAYLVYPHWPIVAYVPSTGMLLNEYCVSFQDHTGPDGPTRLPDSDDVLAKWMAITADEHALISGANMHLPGRQIDPERVRKDLARLARWERERLVVV